jgi:hypothetical protein
LRYVAAAGAAFDNLAVRETVVRARLIAQRLRLLPERGLRPGREARMGWAGNKHPISPIDHPEHLVVAHDLIGTPMTGHEHEPAIGPARARMLHDLPRDGCKLSPGRVDSPVASVHDRTRSPVDRVHPATETPLDLEAKVVRGGGCRPAGTPEVIRP